MNNCRPTEMSITAGGWSRYGGVVTLWVRLIRGGQGERKQMPLYVSSPPSHTRPVSVPASVRRPALRARKRAMLAVSHPAASTPRPAQGVRGRLCLGRLAGLIRILSRPR
jgi:hypothetical protein